MREKPNRDKVVLCILVALSLAFTSFSVSLSQGGSSSQAEYEKALERQKKSEERAKKEARLRWEKRKRAEERTRREARLRWEKRKRAEERTKKKEKIQLKKELLARQRAKKKELAEFERQRLKEEEERLAAIKEEREKLSRERAEREKLAELEEHRLKKEEAELNTLIEKRERLSRDVAEKEALAKLEKRRLKEEEEAKLNAIKKLEELIKQRDEKKELAEIEKQKLKEEEERLAVIKEEKEKLSLEHAERQKLVKLEEHKLKEEETRLKKLKKERERLSLELVEKETLANLEEQKLREEEERLSALIEEREKFSEELADKEALARSEEQKLKEEKEKLARKEEEIIKKAARFKKEPPGGPLEAEEKEGLTLDECISIAMENHLSLGIAKKQLRLAEFRLLEATRKLGPTVTAKWEESQGDVGGYHYDGTKYSIEGKQPIFYGGELVFSVKQAKVNLEIVRNDYDRIKNELILQVKKAYYSLDKTNRALQIQKKLYKKTEALYDIARAGYEAGVVPQVEFLKASSQYNQTNFQVVSAEEDLSIANLLLQQAMNIDEEVEIAAVGEPRIIELNLEDCFDLAYLNRPEIKISHLSMDYFGYEEKIMKARANWPRVDLLGYYAKAREDYIRKHFTEQGERAPRGLQTEFYYGAKVSVPFWGSTLGYSLTEEDWTPVVQTLKGTQSTTHTMSLSLFDKLEDISGVQEAELEFMRSKDELNKKKQEISLEVKETFFKYRKAILLINVAESKVEFQAKQVEILDIRRQLGEAQYSDVIEEMIKLAEEEFSYAQAISDYYISIASLNKAIGLDGYFEV